jgi:hypothetical protein
MCTAFFEGRPVEPPTATFPEWIAGIDDRASTCEKSHPKRSLGDAPKNAGRAEPPASLSV